ncbi:hypothetical protein BJV77DRAFT_1072392 [Russula vinacea]|nr:hypothetical protein BJV77DRAFT_1072392 [Russula vinacea]
MSSRVGAPHDFLERITGLRSEATNVSAENAGGAQVSRGFKIAYNKILNSWAAVTAGPPGDALPDVVTLEQLSEVKWTWEKARESVRAALATLTSEPAQLVASMHTRSAFKRWAKSLVCSS